VRRSTPRYRPTGGKLLHAVRLGGPVGHLREYRLAAGAPAAPGEELAHDRGPDVRLRCVHAFDPRPSPVYPGEDLLDEVLGQVRVTAQHMREAQQHGSAGDHEVVEPVGHASLRCQQLAKTYVGEPGAAGPSAGALAGGGGYPAEESPGVADRAAFAVPTPPGLPDAILAALL